MSAKQTVGEKVESLREFAERTDNARGAEVALEDAEALAAFPPDMRLLGVWDAIAWDDLSPEERFVVKWQMRRQLPLGDFESRFFEAIDYADDQTLERLAAGMPEVRGVIRWRNERGFARRLRQMPFDFSL
jgi:hypothetical protein